MARLSQRYVAIYRTPLCANMSETAPLYQIEKWKGGMKCLKNQVYRRCLQSLYRRLDARHHRIRRFGTALDCPNLYQTAHCTGTVDFDTVKPTHSASDLRTPCGSYDASAVWYNRGRFVIDVRYERGIFVLVAKLVTPYCSACSDTCRFTVFFAWAAPIV